MNASCACGGTPNLLFACSGAADMGEIADQSIQADYSKMAISDRHCDCITGDCDNGKQ